MHADVYTRGPHGSCPSVRWWKQRAPHLKPDEEYDLVEAFADMVGIRDWYPWLPDPGHHEITGTTAQEGSNNDALLRAKHPAAVWYLLSALERSDKLTTEQSQEIAFEIGAPGQNGLDYSSPAEKYVLKTLPGERFSGLQLMCIMNAGFKRFAPEVDGGIELDAPFLQALVIYEKRKREDGGKS